MFLAASVFWFVEFYKYICSAEKIEKSDKYKWWLLHIPTEIMNNNLLYEAALVNPQHILQVGEYILIFYKMTIYLCIYCKFWYFPIYSKDSTLC